MSRFPIRMHFRVTFALFVGFTAAALLLTACARAPVRPDHSTPGEYAYTKEYVSWLARRLLKEHDTPGVSIALVDDQRVVWATGFGYADVAARRPADADTVYRVGSISKLFTASAVMQLAERGRLDIDAPIKRYLPGLSVKSRFVDAPPITARNIMTHHSGLPADIMKGMWTHDGEQDFADTVALLNNEYVAYPPNFIYSYSNVAVSLLGYTVQQVSGMPFYDYMQSQLIEPLGMRHSAFALRDDMRPLLAKGYNDGDEVDAGRLRDVPAAGLYSSVSDLSQLLKMVFAEGRAGDRRVLAPGSLAEMLTVQNRDVKLDFNFDIGLGWFLVDHGIHGTATVASHGGGTPCYFSQLIALPEHKLGVVALANACSSGPVVSETAVTALKLALEEKTGFHQPLENVTRMAPVATDPDPVQLAGFSGRYATWVGLIEVEPRGDHLRASLGGWHFNLIPHVDGSFGIQFKLLGLIPIHHLFGIDLDNVLLRHADVDSRQVVVMTFKGRDQVFGEKIHPRPIPKAWLARLGDMEIVNPDEYMQFRDNQLVNDDGILVMSYRLKMPVLPEQRAALPIYPISDDEAVIFGLGRGMGETVHVEQINGEEMLSFSGYRARWTAYDDPAHAPGHDEHPRLAAQHAPPAAAAN